MGKFKKGAVFAALGLALAAGSASAFTITAGDIKFTIDNYDAGTTGYGNAPGVKCATVAACNAVPGIAPAPGSGASGFDTMGIFSVAAITNISTGADLFIRGLDGYLTGIFTGLSDNNVSVGACSTSTCTTAKATGGVFNLWKNAVNYTPALGPNGAGVDLPNSIYPGISGGELYLSGVFAPGVVFGDFTTTYQSIFDNFSFAGNGSGFFDVTGGSARSTFDTNALVDANGNRHDLFTTVTFDDVNGAASNLGWSVKSSGQISGNAVPEPGSLALVALALLGVAGVARQRRG